MLLNKNDRLQTHTNNLLNKTYLAVKRQYKLPYADNLYAKRAGGLLPHKNKAANAERWLLTICFDFSNRNLK